MIYRITSLLQIVDWMALGRAVFPGYDGQPAIFDGCSVIEITFDAEQTPVDLGPLVKVERVTDLSTLP